MGLWAIQHCKVKINLKIFNREWYILLGCYSDNSKVTSDERMANMPKKMRFLFLKIKINKSRTKSSILFYFLNMADRREVPNFPGYFVYEDGTVFSEKGKIWMTPQKTSGNNTLNIKFRNPVGHQMRTKTFTLHHLVYGCFVDENALWDDKIIITHKNGNQRDNRLQNLEVTTYSENIKKKKVDNNTSEKFEKRVRQYDLEGKIIREFKSIKEASEITGESYHGISKVCLGKHETTSKKYKWEQVSEKLPISKEKMDEIKTWLPIPSYPEHLISKNGEIFYTKTGNLLEALNNDNPDIYMRVAINYEGKKYSAFIHKLVAETYIPNPENKKQVNHKDGNKHNNNVSNLEWVTPKENSQHACNTGLCPRPKGKGVIQIDPESGEEIARFDFLIDAAKAVNLKSGETIKLVCNGKRNKAGNYKWKWME